MQYRREYPAMLVDSSASCQNSRSTRTNRCISSVAAGNCVNQQIRIVSCKLRDRALDESRVAKGTTAAVRKIRPYLVEVPGSAGAIGVRKAQLVARIAGVNSLIGDSAGRDHCRTERFIFISWSSGCSDRARGRTEGVSLDHAPQQEIGRLQPKERPPEARGVGLRALHPERPRRRARTSLRPSTNTGSRAANHADMGSPRGADRDAPTDKRLPLDADRQVALRRRPICTASTVRGPSRHASALFGSNQRRSPYTSSSGPGSNSGRPSRSHRTPDATAGRWSRRCRSIIEKVASPGLSRP